MVSVSALLNLRLSSASVSRLRLPGQITGGIVTGSRLGQRN